MIIVLCNTVIGEAFSWNISCLCDIDKCFRVVFCDDFFDLIDLFFTHNADKHIVLHASVETCRMDESATTMEFLGDFRGDFIVMVWHDIEDDWGVQAWLNDIGDFRTCKEGYSKGLSEWSVSMRKRQKV